MLVRNLSYGRDGGVNEVAQDVKAADMLRIQGSDAGIEVVGRHQRDICVLYCGDGVVDAGRGGSKKPRYKPMQRANDGRKDGQEERVVRCRSTGRCGSRCDPS